MPDLPLDDGGCLREDGTVFPPVTPDVPAPPGYVSPLEGTPAVADLVLGSDDG